MMIIITATSGFIFAKYANVIVAEANHRSTSSSSIILMSPNNVPANNVLL
jgi:hypothetical protein